MARRRPMNIPRIKAAVMFVLGVLVSALSGVTGIGGQVMATPMSAFLLGFSPAKAAGTGLAFALTAAIASVAAACVAHVPISASVVLVVAVSSTVGAAIAVRWSTAPRLALVRRTAHAAVMLMLVFVITEATRGRIGGPRTLPYPFLATLPGIVLLSLVCGALSTALQISSSVLLTPALVFGAAIRPHSAIATSLLVMAIASILPVAAYSRQGSIDQHAGRAMVLGGIPGGIAGGLLLSVLNASGNMYPLALFAACAMFLSAYTIWSMT